MRPGAFTGCPSSASVMSRYFFGSSTDKIVKMRVHGSMTMQELLIRFGDVSCMDVACVNSHQALLKKEDKVCDVLLFQEQLQSDVVCKGKLRGATFASKKRVS